MKLCIDLDGVLANFTSKALEQVKKIYDIEMKYEDITKARIGEMVWDKMSEEQREKYGEPNVYGDICPAGFFYSLDTYPGAVEGVKNLYHAGHKIIFLTKPLEWKHSSSEKMEWLDLHFNDIEYSVIMVSDMSSKYRVQCDCLIDDDPRALVKLPPYHGICIARPWNKEFREKYYEGIVVDSMREASEWLINNEDFMSLPDRGGIDAPKSC